jgi:tetratricopeptide (TPR) repeat protein
MGMIYWRRGETDQASDCYTRSLKINEELDNRGGIAYALKALGVIFRTKGNYKKSLEKINQSLEIIEEIGYKRGIGAELNNMGTVYQKIGDNDMALENSTRSLDIAKELGDKFGESAALHCLGLVYYSKGEYNKGISFFEQSLTLQKEMGVGANDKVGTTAYLSLSYKYMNKKYDKHEILMLIDQSHKIEFEINFCIYQLLEDKLFLETAYKQVQTLANDLKPKPKKSFLNYPIPKAITEEWKKINNPTSL